MQREHILDYKNISWITKNKTIILIKISPHDTIHIYYLNLMENPVNIVAVSSLHILTTPPLSAECLSPPCSEV